MDNPWIRQRSLFSKIFNRLLFGLTLRIYLPNLKSISLLVLEIIRIGVLGGVANPQYSGREGCRASGMEPFARPFMSSYRHSIVAFALPLCIWEILKFLCTSTPLFPPQWVTHLDLVSSKFPHVPLGLGGWPMGYEERRCWANCPRFSSCGPDTTRLQTDGRTHKWHAIARPRSAV